jgi:hypothetical protein
MSGTPFRIKDRAIQANFDFVISAPPLIAVGVTGPTFLNGWSNLDATRPQAGYVVLRNGLLVMQGVITNVAGTASQGPAFTLPKQHSPRDLREHWFNCYGTRMEVAGSTGSVNVPIAVAAGFVISLDGISFVVGAA